MEAEAEGIVICLANVGGTLSALDNRCAHRGGPLGQGHVQGESVVCPWHSWAFNVNSGLAEFPPDRRVKVYPVELADDDVLVKLE